MIRKALLTAAVLLTATIGLSAQSQTATSGGEASGSGGSASYTVGQAAFQSYGNGSETVTEGVQQAYEIAETTRTENERISLVQVSAYPNPVTDYLRLSVEMEGTEDLSFQLFDMQGKLLRSQKLADTETQINMTGHVPSTYIIKILSGNQAIKEFKIIKQ